MSTTMTIRLDDDLKRRLENLADSTHRSKSYLATEAIRDFVELNEWQVQEIKTAIQEANNGEFATDAAAANVFKKWGVNAN